MLFFIFIFLKYHVATLRNINPPTHYITTAVGSPPLVKFQCNSFSNPQLPPHVCLLVLYTISASLEPSVLWCLQNLTIEIQKTKTTNGESRAERLTRALQGIHSLLLQAVAADYNDPVIRLRLKQEFWMVLLMVKFHARADRWMRAEHIDVIAGQVHTLGVSDSKERSSNSPVGPSAAPPLDCGLLVCGAVRWNAPMGPSSYGSGYPGCTPSSRTERAALPRSRSIWSRGGRDSRRSISSGHSATQAGWMRSGRVEECPYSKPDLNGM